MGRREQHPVKPKAAESVLQADPGCPSMLWRFGAELGDEVSASGAITRQEGCTQTEMDRVSSLKRRYCRTSFSVATLPMGGTLHASDRPAVLGMLAGNWKN